jgi:hypothetical protein
VPLNKALDPVKEPFTFILPEVKIEPVKISVSAFTENDSPVFANMLVDPVTIKEPDMFVEPVTLKIPLL